MTVRLTLYVSGDSSESRRDAVAVRHWCDRHLEGRYRLEVRDILDPAGPPGLAPVLVTPTLVLESPPARVVGDLADVPGAMAALGLVEAGPP